MNGIIVLLESCGSKTNITEEIEVLEMESGIHSFHAHNIIFYQECTAYCTNQTFTILGIYTNTRKERKSM